MTQPRILDKFRIDELSGVDRPAQTGARAVIMKRDFSDKERQAMADRGEALPDGSFPIANVSDLENAIHAIGRAKDPAKAKAHIIARAKSLGATDKLPQDWSVSKSQSDSTGDPNMSVIAKALGLPETATEADITAAITKAKADAGKSADLEKSVALLKAKADLTDAEKAHMKTMSDGDADDFATKSKADRAKAMEKAAAGDETFTASTGAVISKKAVGDGAYALLKSQDEALKKMQGDLAIEKAERENAAFAKRAADELGHLSGPIEKKAALLKGIAGLPEAERVYATELLKGADAMAKAGFAKMGHRDASDQDADPSSRLDKMAKARMETAKEDYATAYDAVCKTEEGRTLYKAYRDAKPVASAA
jgi:hypothetical protein